MKNIFTKEFLINFGIAIIFLLLLLFTVSYSLNIYTRHGQSQKVPDVSGKSFEKAIAIIENAGLEYEILDSSFVDNKPALAVICQNPTAGSLVKSGRTIYLTINSSTKPTVEMPDLVGRTSYKFAKMQLEGFGLVVDSPIMKPDPHQGSVIQILVNGLEVLKGKKIPKGTHVTLVVGDGLTNSKIALPYLIGLTYAAAKEKILSLNLSLGAVVVDDGVSDTNSAFVYRQAPEFEPGKYIRIGDDVDIFISKTLPDDIEIDKSLYDLKSDSLK